MFTRRCNWSSKKKLLVVAGAGSTRDFGMPSSDGIHDIFLRSAAERFPLNSAPEKNLYVHLHDQLGRYWRAQGSPVKPNFEDVLFAITQLAAMPPEPGYEKFTPALGAFVKICDFPEVGFGSQGIAVDSSMMMRLAEYLVFDLLQELRKRCANLGPRATARTTLRRFFDLLSDQFDVAVVTTNYDDLIFRALPCIETGFDLSDNRIFKQERILLRKRWPCFLHLHGSIHFDEVPDGGVNTVRWSDDLTQQFYQGPGLTTPRYSDAGYASPASPIIVGYAKAEKIGGPPYRTYYSELARLVYNSEALLILGHSLGLADTHLREAFTGYNDARKRRVVVVDHVIGKLDESSTATRVMGIFACGAGFQRWRAFHSDGCRLEEFKATQEFDHCMSEDCSVSIWYGGMREACNSAERIVAELTTA